MKLSMSHDEDCLYCATPIEIFSIGPCNHKGVCGNCILRSRYLYGKRFCLSKYHLINFQRQI